MANRDNKGKFVKGKSGNAKGRPPLPDYIRQIRNLTAEEIVSIMETMLLPYDEASKVLQNKKESSFLKVVIGTLVNKGDIKALQEILSRVVPPPRKNEVNKFDERETMDNNNVVKLVYNLDKKPKVIK